MQHSSTSPWLKVLAALSLVFSATGAYAFSISPSLDISFRLSVQGLGEATFYTFQQQLPHPTLPYAVQDEWVQFVYPDGAAAVYNVAELSPSKLGQGATLECAACSGSDSASNRNLLLGQTHRLHDQSVSPGHGVNRGTLRPTLAENNQCDAQWRVVGGSSSAKEQRFVAVQAGDALSFHEWFQRQTAASGGTDSTFTIDRMAKEPDCAAERAQLLHDNTSGSLVEPTTISAVSGLVPPPLVHQKPPHQAPSSMHPVCKHRNFMLYLGMSIPLSSGGGTVSQQQIQQFLALEVSPRVQGFTLVRASGFWEGESEETMVVEIISDAAGIAAVVTEIAEAYKSVFKQDAVLVKENMCPKVQFI